MVLDKDIDAFCGGAGDEFLMMRQELDGGLGEEDVNTALEGVEGDGVVRLIWGEDGDAIARFEGVNGGFVGVWILLIICRERAEGCVEIVVDSTDVCLKMLP